MVCPICKDVELEVTQVVELRHFTVCKRCTNYIIYTQDAPGEPFNEKEYILIPVKEIHPVEDLKLTTYDWKS